MPRAVVRPRRHGGAIVAVLIVLSSVLAVLPMQAADAYDEPALLFKIADERITESSGLASSRVTPGVVWTHDDSGSEPELFALREDDGATVAALTLEGAENVDWEDMAIGPGPDCGSALYVGDIGDNGKARTSVRLYVADEPELDPERPSGDGTLATTAFELAYPDGPHDAETLLVHPRTGEVAIVTKEGDGQSGVYAATMPLDPDAATALTRIAELDVSSLATGGDVTPDGSRVAVRTYGDFLEWSVPDEGGLADAFATEPVRRDLPSQQQGESLAYARDGSAVLAGSEGEQSPVHILRGGAAAGPPPGPAPTAAASPSPSSPTAPSPSASPTASPTASPSASPSVEPAGGAPRRADAAGPLPRIDDEGPVERAAALSSAVFTSAETVVLARADEYPDALAGTALAEEVDGPILLTPSDGLAPELADELRRLGARSAYLLGGTAALGDAVAEQLRGLDIEPRRLAGPERFATAAAVLDEVVDLGGPVEEAVVALGGGRSDHDDYVDALAAGGLAGTARAPVLLVGPHELPEPTRDALSRHLPRGAQLILAGGAEAVGEDAAAALESAGYEVGRLAGDDRYETAALLTTAALDRGADLDPVLVATGRSFADALVSAPAAHHLGGLVLLVDPFDLDRSPATRELVEERREEIGGVLVMGDDGAVTDAVVDQLEALLLGD